MTEGKIYAAMAAAMADVGAIGKDSKNQQQGFNFRGIDEVYNAVHSILAKHKIFTVPTVLKDETEERQTKSGTHLIYRKLTMQYRFYTVDGSFVDAIVLGEGMDSGDKASNKAMSIAHKYTFLQTFSIPTKEEKDPDFDSHEESSKISASHKSTPPPVGRPLTGPEAVQKAQDLIASGKTGTQKAAPSSGGAGTAGDYIVTFGKFKGTKIANIDIPDLDSYIAFLSKPSDKPMSLAANDFIRNAKAHLADLGAKELGQTVMVYDEPNKACPPPDEFQIPF